MTFYGINLKSKPSNNFYFYSNENFMLKRYFSLEKGIKKSKFAKKEFDFNSERDYIRVPTLTLCASI